MSAFERIAYFALLASGAATLWEAVSAMPAAGTAGQLLLLQAAIGAALMLAAVLPAVRFPAIVAGLLGGLAPLAVWGWSAATGAAFPWVPSAQLAILAVAGAVLVHLHRQEARWDGMLTSRQEG